MISMSRPSHMSRLSCPSRRSFVRAGAGLAAIIAAGKAPAAFIRSMLAARNGTLVGGKLTARDYVQDGLIAMWDGIENAGEGVHDSNTMVWVNLGSLGSDYDAVRLQGSWSSDGAVIDRIGSNRNVFLIPNYLQRNKMVGEWSYEIGFSPASGWSENYSGLWGNHGSGKGIVGGQYDNGTVYFTLYSPDTRLYSVAASHFEVGRKYTISQAASDTLRKAITYENGAAVKTTTSVSVKLAHNDAYSNIGAAYGGVDRRPTDRAYKGTIHFLRVYNRMLLADEIAANYAVDKARFNLPAQQLTPNH